MRHRIINGLYRFAVYLAGVVVLVAAVAVTLVRFALPGINEYKAEIEARAGRHLGRPVAIHSIEASWEGWTPRLFLKGIDLLDKDGARPIASFKAALIDLAPVASLWRRRFVPRSVMISGLSASVERQLDGSLRIGGVSVADPERPANGNNEFAEWLFQQERIAIEDSAIEWRDLKHQQEPAQLSEVALSMRADREGRLQMTGAAKLPGKYGDRIRFAFDARGDLWSPDWSGELHVAATEINLARWLGQYRMAKTSLAGGSADLEVWSNWENAGLRGLQGRLAYSEFDALAGGGALHVNELAGWFKGERSPNGDKDWRFSVKLDQLVTENGAWPAANLEFVALEDGPARRYALRFDYLKPADLMPLTAGVEGLPEALKAPLKSGAISAAELTDGLLIYRPGTATDQRFIYDVTFRDLAAALAPDKPAISRMSGRLRGSASRALLSLDATAGAFRMPLIYEDAVSFTRISGELLWLRNAAGWKLQTDALRFETDDFSLVVGGDLTQDEAPGLPWVNLVAELKSDQLENLHRYMPLTPKFRIKEWMGRALLAGRVDSALVALRGRPNDFPFRDNNGRLKGVAYLSEALVEYSPKWSPIDKVDAEVLLDNEKMSARFYHGEVFEARLTSGAGRIEDLTQRPKVIFLNGRVKGKVRDLGLFVAQSPLAQNLILMYANDALKAGAVDLALNMGIPLRPPGLPADAPFLQSDIDGALKLGGAKLEIDTGKLALKDIAGVVRFTRDSASGRDLHARFAGQPVTLRLSGAKNDRAAPPTFEIAGRASSAFIETQLASRYPGLTDFAARLGQRMSGETDWLARIAFEQQGSALVQRLQVASDLQGLVLNLPSPLGKAAAERKQLEIGRRLVDAAPLELTYDSVVKAALAPDSQDPQKFKTLRLALGDGAIPPGPEAGIALAGRLEQLSLDQWWETAAFFRSEPGPSPAASREAVAGGAGLAPAGAAPAAATVDIDLRTDRLLLFDQSFDDARLLAAKVADGWRIEAEGAALSGAIVLPQNPAAGNEARLDLERLVLKPVEARAAADLDPKAFPPLRVEVDDFVYGDRQLGALRLAAAPTPAGLSFSEMGFKKPGLSVAGAGVWEKPEGGDRSRFNITLKADKLDEMLDTFGYARASIKKGKTRIAIDAGWEGSPFDFSLDKLNGVFDMRIKKGRLLDVAPSAGRLFGLLSVQTLPRRLSLDFTDLLGKGLAFDEITGGFEITNGHAYTNNLSLRGPSANVLISGRTGLADQDYDQIATVVPQFADNLPVVSAFLGPVGIGVGAMLYLAGNMFKTMNDNIDKLLSQQYAIKGPWRDPKIEKLQPAPPEEKVSLRPAPAIAAP